MATVTRTIGPTDQRRRMKLAAFINADFEEGWLNELARGRIVATDIRGINHGRIVMRVAALFVRYADAHPDVIL
jgi:hypothetical protein